MNKKSIIYFALSVLAFAIALISVKGFNFLLTAPLIFLGISLLSFARLCIGKRFIFFKDFLVQSSILLLLMGAFLSVVNIFYRATPDTSKGKRNIGGLGKSVVKLDHSSHNPLGYSYPPNVKNLTSILVNESKSGSEEIYNVIYNTDKVGNRLNPFRPLNPFKASLFVGGSFTFGEGLNDEQTLPALFSKLSGWDAFNTGMHGYGSHQALKIIEDDNLYTVRTEGENVDLIIYRMIFGHIGRSAGYTPWDVRYGPCYELSKSGEIEYMGSFEECEGLLYSWCKQGFQTVVVRGLNAREPFTRRLATKINLALNPYFSNKYSEKDITRHLHIVEKMNLLAKNRGAKFLVIVEDLEYIEVDGVRSCNINNKLNRLVDFLISKDIAYIKTSKILDKTKCLLGEYEILGDGHPSVNNNLEIANYLKNWLANHFR